MASNLFDNPQEEEIKDEEIGEITIDKKFISEIKVDETNNGAKYGFKVEPDQLIELGAALIEEGKAFNKAITKYKRAYFSELENEVSQ